MDLEVKSYINDKTIIYHISNVLVSKDDTFSFSIENKRYFFSISIDYTYRYSNNIILKESNEYHDNYKLIIDCEKPRHSHTNFKIGSLNHKPLYANIIIDYINNELYLSLTLFID